MNENYMQSSVILKLRETKWGFYLFTNKTPQKLRFDSNGKVLNKLNKRQLNFINTYLESV